MIKGFWKIGQVRWGNPLRTFVSGSLLLLAMPTICPNATAQDRWSSLLSRDRPNTAGSLNNWGNNSAVGSWLAGQASTNSWSLGIRGDSTDVGFVVSQVTPGSGGGGGERKKKKSIVTVEG
jgi:hypothetical protein